LLKIIDNCLGIAEGGGFWHQSSIEVQKLNFLHQSNRRCSAPLLAIPC